MPSLSTAGDALCHAVPWRKFGGEVLVWSPGEQPRALSGLATEVWCALVEPMTIPALRLRFRVTSQGDEISRHFDAAIEIVRPYVVPCENGSRQVIPVIELPRVGPTAYPDQLVNADGVSTAVIQLAVLRAVAPALECWSDLVVDLETAMFCRDHRIVAGLADSVRGGTVGVAPVDMAHVDELDLEAQVHSLRCEIELLRVAALLRHGGIDFRVLKGLATAHLDYSSPHLRQTGDVDLLVRLGDHSKVIEILADAGYRHIVGGDRGHYSLYKSNYFISSEGIEIDVHHRLFRHGRQVGEEIWLDSDQFRIGVELVQALSRPWRLVHAAAHLMFSKGGTFRLSAFLDAVAISVCDRECVEPAVDIARSLGLETVVLEGIRRSVMLAGLDVDLPTPRRRRDVTDAVAMWAFGDGERHRLREQASLLVGMSPHDAARWAGRVIWPNADYRARQRSITSVRAPQRRT